MAELCHTYVNMPNKMQKKSALVFELGAALRQQMIVHGDTQQEVSQKTGVSQSDISRILNGQRKRLGKSAKRLCQYACIDTSPTSEASAARELLSHTLHRAVGDNAAATLALIQVVESLIPLLQGVQHSTRGDIPGAANDNTVAK